MKLYLALAGAAVGLMAQAPKQETPFACNLGAMSAEARKRHIDIVSPRLRDLHTSVRELPDGIEFEFPSDSAAFRLVTEWMEGERACCPFFDFILRMEREGGSLWLRLTGRTGVKDFIQAEFGRWLTKPTSGR